MTNIVLCGGNGTRLWPISRTLMPKQFLKLFNQQSLFQLTILRNAYVCNKNCIVSNVEQYFLAQDQLEELQKSNASFLLEPIGKNTAPAIALACFSLDKDEIVLVTPSDHLIKNDKEYQTVILQAKELAIQDNLVTFGIKPIFPETGLGYIESDGQNVKAFHEKPDLPTAIKYLEAKNYYWNSGMFCFKAGVYLDELQKYAPLIYTKSLEAFERAKNNGIIRIKHDDMLAIPSESIDYAIMEKSKKVKVIPSAIDWSDVGSFDALSLELPNDENNNFIISEKLVNTIDIQDSIIIDTKDALLVSKKGSSQKVKDIVEQLTLQNSQLTNIHLTGHRPWGTYTILDEQKGYKIKRIEVKPLARLSLQKHNYRNEHWVIVSGEAIVRVNDEIFTLKQNESTYIKSGDIHRLSNETNELLVIIEVQVGTYMGEDDIERIEDDYKRENV